MQVLKTQTLTLDSRKGQGTPTNWSVNLLPGLVTCSARESLRVSLQQFVSFNSFPNVTEDNNSFSFVVEDTLPSFDVNLPPGLYSQKDIAHAVTESVNLIANVTSANHRISFEFADSPATVTVSLSLGQRHGSEIAKQIQTLVNRSGFKAEYGTTDSDQDPKLRLSADEPFELSFVGQSWDMLGFLNGITHVAPVVGDRYVIQASQHVQANLMLQCPVRCEAMRHINGLRFLCDREFALYPHDESWRLLGFPQAQGKFSRYDEHRKLHVVESDTVVDPIIAPSLLLRLEGAETTGAMNLSHRDDGSVRAGNVLASIPVPAARYSSIVYDAPSAGLYSIDLLNKDLNQLTFVLEDGRHRKLVGASEYVVVLRIDTLGPSPMAAPIDAISKQLAGLVELSRLQLLSANIRELSK